MYRIIECDSLEMFADRGLTLIVSSTDFYSNEAFDYNEAAGTVSPNPDFDGVNLIFDLPLDTANADYENVVHRADAVLQIEIVTYRCNDVLSCYVFGV